MLLNTEELRKVITNVKSFNGTKNLGVSEFKNLNFFFKDNNIYISTFGDFHSIHKVTFTYKFTCESIPFNDTLYSINIDDFLNSLKFFGQNIELDFQELFMDLHNPELQTQKIRINRVNNDETIISYFNEFFNHISDEVFTNRSNVINNDKINVLIEQLKFRILDKQDTNAYICFLPDCLSVQQFNYTTINDTVYNLDCKIPTDILKFALNMNNESLNIQELQGVLTINSDKLYIKIDEINNNYHQVSGFSVNNRNKLVLNKQELLKNISLIEPFIKENTGYFLFKENKLTISNVSNPLTEGFSIVVSNDIDIEHNYNTELTLGFDLKILKGLINLLNSEMIDMYIENVEGDFLCFVIDEHNKNILAIESYS